MAIVRVHTETQAGGVLETVERSNGEVWLFVDWDEGDQTWVEEWEIEVED